MDSQQRLQAVRSPCGYAIQNVQHVYMLSGECEYMEERLQHMYLTHNEILQSDGEPVQQYWLLAQCLEEKVTAVVNMDVNMVTPDALWELGLGVKTLVGT